MSTLTVCVYLIFVGLHESVGAVYQRDSPIKVKDCIFPDQVLTNVQLMCENYTGSYAPDTCNLMIFKASAMHNYRARVTHLKLMDCPREFLHQKIYRTFKNVQVLDISSLNLTKLIPSTLPGSLLKLNVSYNCLGTVESGIFQRCKNINSMDFSHNEIHEITAKSFTGGEQILQLNFSHNDLIHIENGAFAKLKKLKILNLSYNNIQTIHKDMFYYNENLERLNLLGNPIQRIDTNILTPLMDLAVVNVTFDSVREIDITSVRHSVEIEINVKQEVIIRIASQAELRTTMQHLANLMTLNVTSNQLENMPEIFDLLKYPAENVEVSANFLELLDDLMHNPKAYLPYVTVDSLNFDELMRHRKLHDPNQPGYDGYVKGAKIYLNDNDLKRHFPRQRSNFLPTLYNSTTRFPCGYLKRFMRHRDNVNDFVNNIINGRNLDCFQIDKMESVTFHRTTHNELETMKENSTEAPENVSDHSSNKVSGHGDNNSFGTLQTATEARIELKDSDDVVDSSTVANGSKFKRKNISNEFWMQLQILQFILVIFSVLFILVKAIEQIVKEFRVFSGSAANQTHPTHLNYQRDEQWGKCFQTIELRLPM